MQHRGRGLILGGVTRACGVATARIQALLYTKSGVAAAAAVIGATALGAVAIMYVKVLKITLSAERALQKLAHRLEEVAAEALALRYSPTFQTDSPASIPQLRAVFAASAPEPPYVFADQRMPSWGETTDSGYKTADEGPEEDEVITPLEPRRALPPAPCAVADPYLPPHRGTDDFVDAADDSGDEASVDVSSPARDWASRSVMGEGGSWSCIDSGTSYAGGRTDSLLMQPESCAALEACAALEECAAAENIMLSKADELYKRQEYEAAAGMLAGSEQSVEVQWRRCRLMKELGEAAKRAGDAERCRRLLYEGLALVTTALNHGKGGSENSYVHKWYAIAVSQTSSYEGTKATITKSLIVKVKRRSMPQRSLLSIQHLVSSPRCLLCLSFVRRSIL